MALPDLLYTVVIKCDDKCIAEKMISRLYG